MVKTALGSSARSAAAGAADYLQRILLCCPSIRTVWSVGHEGSQRAAQPSGDLLLFADPLTLHTLRKSDGLHRTDVQILVVFDGDRFESAFGPQGISGSLARWAWHAAAHDVAYYDESRWAHPEGAGGAVVRVRRKAFLIWPSQPALR
jgi:hypothetical protein